MVILGTGDSRQRAARVGSATDSLDRWSGTGVPPSSASQRSRSPEHAHLETTATRMPSVRRRFPPWKTEVHS